MLKKFFLLFKFVWFHPLNKRNRLGAIWRVISWQIVSRIFNAPVLIPFVNGTCLIANRGTVGATGEWYCGLREYEDMGFLLHLLQPGDLFVDVGANIGSYSILAGSCEGVNVLAIEPIPSTFLKLQKNIKVNELDNKVNAINIGMSDQNGTIHFTSNLDILNHVLPKNDENLQSIEVNVLRLDNVMNEKNPTVIKIDVEGYESQVLSGAENVINNPSLLAIILELNNSGLRYGIEDIDIHKLLLSKGFENFEYDPLKHKLKSLEGKFISRSTSLFSSNILYLRNIVEIQRRISRKNSFTLGTGKKI